MRKFQSGATRSSDTDKIDPEAALSPLVLTAYCSYMRKHRLEGAGKAREDDDWQKGIPIASYMKSLLRHVLEAWRRYRQKEDMNDALFAIIFNAQGMLHERLKKELADEAYARAGYPWLDVERAQPIATSNQRPLSRGEQLEQARPNTKPVSSPQPTIYPDDWPDGE